MSEKPKEKKSVKELLEFIEGTGLLTSTGFAIAHQGLGVDDVPKVINLAKEYEVLKDAYTDMDEIPDEIKDMDQTELLLIVAGVYKVYRDSRSAYKTGKLPQ